MLISHPLRTWIWPAIWGFGKGLPRCMASSYLGYNVGMYRHCCDCYLGWKSVHKMGLGWSMLRELGCIYVLPVMSISFSLPISPVSVQVKTPVPSTMYIDAS